MITTPHSLPSRADTKSGLAYVHDVTIEQLRGPEGQPRCLQATSIIVKRPGPASGPAAVGLVPVPEPVLPAPVVEPVVELALAPATVEASFDPLVPTSSVSEPLIEAVAEAVAAAEAGAEGGAEGGAGGGLQAGVEVGLGDLSPLKAQP